MTKQLMLLMLMSAVSSLADDRLKVTNLSSVKCDKEALSQLVVGLKDGEFGEVCSLLISKGDTLILEQYFGSANIDKLHPARSHTKIVTSYAVGKAIEQGKINSVDEPILKYLPEVDTSKVLPGVEKVTIKDCLTMSAGLRWYKQNASKLGVDPKRIIAGGGSAGGHIALLATTNPGLNDPNDSKEHDTSVVAYLLFNPALKPKKDMEVTFENHIKAAMPPMIAFWGTQDNWLTGWKSACEKMQSLENESIEWWTAQGQSHAFFNKQPWKDLTIIAADQFLKKHGLIEGEVTLPAPKNGVKLIKTL